jgi:pantetheine-phosphate adenylyltransferase
MKKIAVFAGSFDPITLGHVNVLERAAPLFDEVILAIGTNTTKHYMFSLEDRLQWAQQALHHISNAQVQSFDGLTIDFCRNIGARYLLRGIRNGGDFEYERSIAHMNKSLHQEIETILMFTDPQFAFIHSTIVREIIRNKGDVSSFLPKGLDVYSLGA